ncbi:MAG: hypothetical protein FJW19_06580, partial [Actinobacteria bacterium]|nr:hypothetical protein [Actinomycetota bacterium]
MGSQKSHDRKVAGSIAAEAASADFVYLDHAASTPMRREAVEAMTPFMSGIYANPSGSHRFSRIVRK